MRQSDIDCKYRTIENVCRKDEFECVFSPSTIFSQEEKDQLCSDFEERDEGDNDE